jgi:hypothetical protein
MAATETRAAYEERTCQHCGAPFTFALRKLRYGHIGAYCSVQCACDARSANRPVIKCDGCGKTLVRSPSRINSTGNYCSLKCSGPFKQPPAASTEATCLECGQRFSYNPNHIGRSHAPLRFCSHQCADAARRVVPDQARCEQCGGFYTLSKRAMHPGNRRNKPQRYCSLNCAQQARSGGLHERNCEGCGKTQTVRAWQIALGLARFCSRACYAEHIRRNPQLAPGYVHGRAYEPYAPGFVRALKRRILERDSYICQWCGEDVRVGVAAREEPDLRNSVHHIDHDKTSHVPSNLVTVCNRCHGHMHGRSSRFIWRLYFQMQMARRLAGYLPPPAPAIIG